MKPCVRNLLLPLALIGLVATAPATRAEGEDEKIGRAHV